MPLTATAAAGLVVVPLVLSGEPRGALFEGDCERPGADTQLSDLHRLVSGEVDPIVLSTGDVLGPDPISGYALEGPPQVQERLLDVLRRSDGEPVFDAVLPGNFELGAAPGRLARLGGPRALPWLVANVELDAPYRRHRVLVRGGATIGVTAVVDDELVPSIDPARRPPVGAPGPALAESSRALRAAGVEVVVAMLHVRRTAGLRRVIEILESIEGPVPDVVLTSALQGDPSFVRLDGLRTWIVPAPAASFEAAVAELVLDEESHLVRVDVRRRRAPVAPSGRADAVRTWVCRQLDVALDETSHDTPLSREAFVRLVLERMRQLADAEIAAVPLGTFGREAAFPLRPSFTRLDVRRALPFDDGLQVARVKGSDLAPLQGLRVDPGVATAGIEGTSVAGRAIDPLRTYRVVTVDFVADGGDGLLDPALFRFESMEGAPTLREAVVGLARRGDLDPAWTKSRAEPGLVDFRANLGASLKSVSVENSGAIESPQLVRQDFLGITGDLQLRLVLDWPDHRFEVAESTRFGIVREDPEAPGADSVTTENEDVTSFELVYTGRLGGGLERPWAPDAGATARLETELTIPDERGYRRALLQAGVGPSWRLTGNLSFRSQLGFRRELLARADSGDPAEAALAEARVALLSSAELRDEVLTNLGPAPSLLSLRIDHTFDLTGAVRDQVLQGRIGVDVPVISGVAFTAAVDVYLVERDRRAGRDISSASVDTSFGIRGSTDFSSVFF